MLLLWLIYAFFGLAVKQVSSSSCVETAKTTFNQIGLSYCAEAGVYTAPIQLGTPRQSLNVAITLDNTLLIIATPSCTGQCPRPAFRPDESQTFVPGTVTYNYTQSQVTPFFYSAYGTIGWDMSSFENSSLLAQNVTTLWVNQISSNVTTMPYDGTWGLGTVATYNGLQIQNYFEELFGNMTVFSIQLSGQYGESVIYYNSIPSNILNTSINVTVEPSFQNTNQWGFYALNIETNTTQQGITSIEGVTSSTYVTISTSLPYIYLNPQLYNYLMTNYFQPVCTLNQDDLWSCPCGNLSMYPELIFTSLEVSINLSPAFYLNQTGDVVGTCLLMLTVNSDTSSSFVPNILGTMVMEKMVVTFYPQQNIMSFSNNYNKVYVIGRNTATFINAGEIVALILVAFLFLMSIVIPVALFMTRNTWSTQESAYNLIQM